MIEFLGTYLRLLRVSRLGSAIYLHLACASQRSVHSHNLSDVPSHLCQEDFDSHRHHTGLSDQYWLGYVFTTARVSAICDRQDIIK